jgi:hypothetical protein
LALLAVNRAILDQNTLDDIRESVQLRALRRLAAPVARPVADQIKSPLKAWYWKSVEGA